MKLLAAFSVIIVFQTSLHAQPGNNEITLGKPMFFPTEKTNQYKVGDRTISIQSLQYGNPSKTICINLHDNEGTSVQAAKSVLEETGGTLIRIENKGQRVIKFRLRGVSYGFDPNRMFSRAGIEQTLRDNRRFSREAVNEIEKFAQQVLQLIPDSATCVIALHNNTEEAFSVKSYLPGHERQWDARAVYADTLQDVDDIVFTTDSLLYQRMADHGYNSIWQHNTRAKKDGSLSIYYGEKERRYINIETQHGKLSQYVEMLTKLMAILEEEEELIMNEELMINN